MGKNAASETMRVMTFNLRFENDRDGVNGWENRRKMVVNLISRHAPDIVGTQEGKWPQLLYLEKMLPGYRACTDNRPYDPQVQCPTLFVKKKRFEILSKKDFWLSETPDVYLSKSWDSAFPRMLSYCRIKDHHAGQTFYAGVTHLDHKGEQARLYQAKMVAGWVAAMPEARILTGDFNEEPGSGVHRTLTVPETPLFDTWEVLEKQEDETAFTHHGFTGTPQHARMDWILVDSVFRVLDARILRDQEKGFYPSDHFPYMADLAVKT